MDFQPADRIKQLPAYLFMRLNEIRDQKMSQGIDVISLGIGDPDLPTPPEVVEALAEAGRDQSTHQYCDDGLPAFREAIVAWYRRRFGVALDPSDNIVPLIGSKEGIAHLPIALINPGDYALVPDPGYPVYAIGTELVGGNVHYLSLTAENCWLPDFDSIPDAVVAASKLMWLCYPNNPTGATATRDQLAAWVDYAKANNSIILYDAAYEAFIQEPDVPHSIFEIDGARECAIEFRSFSKNAGFTGTRCAFTVVPKELTASDGAGNEYVLHSLWARRVATKFNGTSYPIQRAAAAVYTEAGQAQVSDLINHYMGNAKILCEAARSAGLEVFGGTNAPYIWVKTPNGAPSWDIFDKVLNEASVVITPGAGFGNAGEGYFRISAFNSRENAEEVAKRIQAVSW